MEVEAPTQNNVEQEVSNINESPEESKAHNDVMWDVNDKVTNNINDEVPVFNENITTQKSS